MKTKSNVRIKSNIYIRGTADGAFSESDEKLIAQVVNAEALKIIKKRADEKGAELRLSEMQQDILDGKKPVKKVDEIPTVGAIPKTVSIPKASEPSESILAVELGVPEPVEIPKTGESGGLNAEDKAKNSAIAAVEMSEEPPAHSAVETVVSVEMTDQAAAPIEETAELFSSVDMSENAPAIPETPAAEKIALDLSGFVDVTNASAEIFKAGLDSKILLDSISCADKLKIAALRAEFILKNHPNKRLLVLCKTDEAAQKIKSLTGRKLSEGSYIDALDVFAAKYLASKGESAASISALSEDGRISLFNERLQAEDFTDYGFCIIADMDEMIAAHVKTILKLLVLLECGFLLMSDKRRAALAYEPDSDYAKNCAKLADILPEDIKRLSLPERVHGLSEDIDKLITALAEGSPTEEQCRQLLEKTQRAELSELAAAESGTAVLCKDSGCAEYLCYLLNKNNIPHTALRSDRAAPVRHIADVLWDSHEKVIERENFIKRFNARCAADAPRANECYNALCAITGRDPSEGLETALLAEKIMLGGMPRELMNGSSVKLAVAEIRESAPREFDKVYIVENEFSDSPDAKQLYAAAAGRTEPPALLKLDSMPEAKANANDRHIFISGDGEKPSFGTGSPEDIDPSSFISGSVGDAVRKQAYISKNVKSGDSLTLKLNGGIYDITHGKTVIGKMSASFSENLTLEFGGKQYFETLPDTISGIYVTDVITVVSCRDPKEYEGIISPQYREHRFWFGVEIGGFAAAE